MERRKMRPPSKKGVLVKESTHPIFTNSDYISYIGRFTMTQDFTSLIETCKGARAGQKTMSVVEAGSSFADPMKVVQQLAQMPHLEVLVLRGERRPLGVAAGIGLALILRRQREMGNLEKLRVLDLSYSGLGSSIRYIVQVLQMGFPCLTDLSLQGNLVDETTTFQLGQVIRSKSLPKLANLNLYTSLLSLNAATGRYDEVEVLHIHNMKVFEIAEDFSKGLYPKLRALFFSLEKYTQQDLAKVPQALEVLRAGKVQMFRIDLQNQSL